MDDVISLVLLAEVKVLRGGLSSGWEVAQPLVGSVVSLVAGVLVTAVLGKMMGAVEWLAVSLGRRLAAKGKDREEVDRWAARVMEVGG